MEFARASLLDAASGGEALPQALPESQVSAMRQQARARELQRAEFSDDKVSHFHSAC